MVSSVARGEDGSVYNVNADTAAAALAVALGADKLVVLTDVEGLYADWPASDEVIRRIARRRARGDAADAVERHGAEDGGVRCAPCAAACRRAHVIDGRLPHGVLLEVVTDAGVGTMVLPDDAQLFADEDEACAVTAAATTRTATAR